MAPYTETLKRGWKLAGITLVALSLTWVASDGAINGVSPRQAAENKERAEQEQKTKGEEKQDGPLAQVRAWYRAYIPGFLESLPLIQARAFANFKEQEVSTRPANWFLKPDDELVRIVTGAQLQEENLRGVNAEQAFLMKADLRKANLNEANLKEANLADANLQKANLFRTNLQKANLYNANLQRAYLHNANLQEANLINPNLQKAILHNANLRGADLRAANLTGVTILTQAKLNQACVDEDTILPEWFKRPAPCSEEDLPQK